MQSMMTGSGTSSPGTESQRELELWDTYQALGGSYDELKAPADGVRPHWRPFVTALRQLGGDEIRRRWEESQDLIRQNGVTYNVYGDPRGMDRPWQLDPLPLLFAPAEWRSLDEGLTQRARLLDLILADLYGAQGLLARGFLPPELVFGNPAFLHACHG